MELCSYCAGHLHQTPSDEKMAPNSNGDYTKREKDNLLPQAWNITPPFQSDWAILGHVLDQ
jgi:hypothetical protein